MKNRVLMVVSILALILAACGSPAASEATPTPYPTPVRPTYTVQRGDIKVTALIYGRVTARALQTVSFEMDGHVSDVYVNVNDVVKAGQLLGELSEMKSLQTKANETRRQIRGAQIDLEIAKLTLEKYKAENKPSYDIKIQELEVERAQMAYDDVLQQLGLDPSTDALAALDEQVTKARLFAPADGMIISAVSVGRSVTTTTPAFVLGDGNQLELVVTLNSGTDDATLKELFEGMTVTASRDTTPDKPLTGTIRQLPSPFGTGPSNSHDVVIALDQTPSPATYQSGDKMTVELELANKTGILWLPPDAIHQVSGRMFVIVDDTAGPKRIEIQIGLKTRDMIEILSGLEEGQVVIGP